MRNRVNTALERVILTGVSRLIPVSRSLEGYLRGEGFAPERIRMVANGVPTPGPLPVRDAPAGEWVIGSVALFRPRKGIEVLIEAVAMLRQQGKAVRLRAVGPFETVAYQTDIMALVNRLGVADEVNLSKLLQHLRKPGEIQIVFAMLKMQQHRHAVVLRDCRH